MHELDKHPYPAGALSIGLQFPAEPDINGTRPSVLIADPGCAEAATLITDGACLALFDEHAVCLGRFLLDELPAGMLAGVRKQS